MSFDWSVFPHGDWWILKLRYLWLVHFDPSVYSRSSKKFGVIWSVCFPAWGLVNSKTTLSVIGAFRSVGILKVIKEICCHLINWFGVINYWFHLYIDEVVTAPIRRLYLSRHFPFAEFLASFFRPIRISTRVIPRYSHCMFRERVR